MKSKKSIEKIAVFGDSTALGFVDTSGKGGWAGRLKRWFEKRDYKGNSLYNLSVDGGTTRDLLERAEVESKYRELDLVILDIGLNDLRRKPKINSLNVVPIKEFSKNLEKIIKIFKKFAGKIVFLTPSPVDERRTLPVSWGTSHYSLEDEKSYYAVMKKICKKERIYFIDIFAGWLAGGNKYKKLLYDGLHPNARGHEEIFKSVLGFLKKKKILN